MQISDAEKIFTPEEKVLTPEELKERKKKKIEAEKKKEEKELRDMFLVKMTLSVDATKKLGRLNSKETVDQIFMNKIAPKLNRGFDQDEMDKNVLFFCFANIISSDRLDTLGFYKRFVKGRKDEKKLYSFGTTEDQLNFVKKFYTEFFFKDNSEYKLSERIYDRNNNVVLDFAPELEKLTSIRDCTWTTAYHCLEKNCGNVIFADEHSNLLTLSPIFNEQINKNYERIEGTNVFIKRDLQNDKSNSQTIQDTALSTYMRIVDTYFKNPSNIFEPKNLTRGQFEKRLTHLNVALSLVKFRLSEKTKEKLQFQLCKESVGKILNNKDVVFESYGMKEKENKIFDAIEKSEDKKELTDEEKTAIENFSKTIKVVDEMLKSEDDFAVKKLKFFLFTKMQPNMFWNLSTSFKESDLCDENLANEIEDVKKALLKKEMFWEKSRGEEREFDTDKQLRHFKGTRIVRNGEVVVDVQGENYEKFIEEIGKFVKKNHLPNSEICHRTVGEAFVAYGEKECKKIAEQASLEKGKV